MIEIENFIKLSKYAGERFDLVQAAGGNSSVKLKNNEMLIKASGFLLSDLDKNNGYSRVNTKKIQNILSNQKIIKNISKFSRENLAKKLVNEATIDLKNRPSIETLLHSTLYKYTLHTHPVVVNMILIQKEWRNLLLSIFKDDKIATVSYKTPGIELALELNKEINNFKKAPKIIFLQNHGLIISSDNADEIKFLTELVLEKIEVFLKLDMHRYKLTNNISSLVNSVKKNSNITYLSEDIFLNNILSQNKDLFLEKPFCPDSLVFCGISAVILENLSDISKIKQYKEKYSELPKIIIFKKYIFINALNVKKAKEIEEVLKFQLMVLDKNLKTNKNFLNFEEISYLCNWEAENFRKKI